MSFRAEILTPEYQINRVKAVQNLNQYQRFVNQTFERPIDPYYHPASAKLISEIIPKRMDHPVHTLFAFTDMLFSQIAVVSPVGKFFRHVEKKFQRNLFSPEHHLALACYAAKINTETYQRKQDLVEALAIKSPQYAPGIWGLEIGEIKNGEIKYYYPLAVNEFTKLAELRLHASAPICMIDPELNSKLGSIGFTSFQADRITHKSFMKNFYPQVQEVLGETMDVEAIFRPF